MNTSLEQERPNALVSWFAIALVVLGFAFATGRTAPLLVPDSQSYIEYPFDSFDGMLRSTRTPGYPAFLGLVRVVFGMAAVPLVQMFVHITASWVFMRELHHWQVRRSSQWTAALAIAVGCTAVDNEAIISTDLLAASLGVLAAASLLASVRRDFASLPAIGTVLFSIVAIAVRPAYLSLVPWVTIAGAMLCLFQSRMTKGGFPLRSILICCAMSGLIAMPIVGWAAVRGVMVHDFGILPFGHQGLAGITTQLVTEEELRVVAIESADLAEEILASKQRYFDDGFRFSDGAASATMTIESRWEDCVWRIIVPAADALYPDDPIASHQAIKMLNREIIFAYPLRYVRWVVLAARRACWGTAANIVMHPIFLPLLVLAVILKLLQLLKQGTAPDTQVSTSLLAGVDAIFIVAVTYFVVQVGLVILTSPPLGRFADAAAIFIPAWIAAWLAPGFRPGFRLAK